MYLAVDIGGTKTLVAVLTNQGVISEQVKFPTPKKYDDFLEQLSDTLKTFKTQDYRAGCVGLPGTPDRDKGSIVLLGNLPWENEPIVHDVEKIAQCPIVIENDAKLAGLSETMLIKDEFKKVLYVTIGTGIGLGLTINGKISTALGDAGGKEMMLEHNGKILPWEDFASGRAIVKQFGKKASEIQDKAAWKIIARNIAAGVLALNAVIQPDALIIGGGVGGHFEKFKAPLIAELQKYATPIVPIPPLRQAARPEEAVLFGCYDLAKSFYATDPA